MKKDQPIIELFFNEPTKHWHFEEILKEAKISRPQAAHWLNVFVKESLIQKIKPKRKMPYYVSNYNHPNYQIKKKLFALQKMEHTGFLSHLTKLKAKTIIIFGSFSRWDWYKGSDIDLFIYGGEEPDLSTYRQKLNREIQVFTAKTKQDLKKIHAGLLQNILEGYRVKGSFDFVEVKAHA